LKIFLYSLMWVIEGPLAERSLRRRRSIATNFDRSENSHSISSPLFPSWCWAAFSSRISLPVMANFWIWKDAILPGSELGVLANYLKTSTPTIVPNENFYSDFRISLPGKSSIELRGLVPCVSRLANFNADNLILIEGCPEKQRQKTSHHCLLHGRAIGWISLSEPSGNLPSDLR